MTDWVQEFIRQTGYFGIVVLMVVENVFPPIPSEVIMPLAGYLSSQDQLTLFWVITAGTLGSVIGAMPLYYLDHKLGTERLKKFSREHGRWFAINESDIDRTQRWFDRYGIATVFFLRLVPGLRSLISIPAGLAHMNLVPFLIFTTLGAAIWTALLAFAGQWLGHNFNAAKDYTGPVSTAIIAALLLWYIWRVIRAR